MNIDTHQEALLRAEEWLLDGIRARLSHTIKEPGAVYFRSLKALCEIAYLEYCVLCTPSSRIQAALSPLLWELMHNPEFLSLVRHNTEHANLFIPLLTAALSTGMDYEKGLRHDLENLLYQSSRSTKEKLPFRHIDLLHGLYRLTGQTGYLKKIAHCAQFGCLGSEGQLSALSLSDEYAITHTIFYVCDFGRLEWQDSIMPVDKLEAVLATLADIAVDNNDNDILGEYLLCQQYIGVHEEHFLQNLRWLATRQDAAGFWSGPTKLATKLRDEGFAAEDMEFFEHYHTTIVVRATLDYYLHRHNIVPSTTYFVDIDKQRNSRTTFNTSCIRNRAQQRGNNLAEAVARLWTQGIALTTQAQLASPYSILPALELLLMHKKAGGRPMAGAYDSLAAIIELPPLEHKNNISFVQIWLIAYSLLDHNRYTAQQAATHTDAIRELQAAYEYTSLPVAALLHPLGTLSETAFSNYIVRYTRKKLVQKHTFDILCAVIYGIDYIKRDPLLLEEVIDYIQSMNSQWSCFGWLKEVNCSEADTLDFYALAAIGTLSAHNLVNAVWEDEMVLCA